MPGSLIGEIGKLVTNSLHENSAALTGAQEIQREFQILLESNMNGFVPADLVQNLDRLAKRDGPPSNNMGGPYLSSPLDISHSEIKIEVVVQKTMIDWFGFSTCYEIEGVLIGLQILWPDMVMSTSKAGMQGYPNCKALYVDEVQYGLVGYGAKHGRNSISLTGVACKTITTHEQFDTLRGLMDVLDARLSRVDLCFDFYRGEVTFDYAVFAFKRGDFKSPKANKDPESRIVTSTGGRGENLGRTLYVGPRKGEKFARVYEKGLEVFAKMPEEYREACTEREMSVQKENGIIDDDGRMTTVADDWLRLEVEFKRVDKDRPIPLDIIVDRDSYFAGAFPFYGWALNMGDGKGRSRIKSNAQINHDKLIMAHRAAYGNHVHTLKNIGFTDREIVQLLDTGRHNQKLLKAGLVSVEQQAVRKFRADGDDSDIPF